MTEAEWLAKTDPTPMLEFIQAKVGERKLRLFACACCRFVWRDLEEPRIRALVLTSEQYADGAASLDQLRSAWSEATTAYAHNQGEAGNQDVEEAALGCGEGLQLSTVIVRSGESTIFFDTDLYVIINNDSGSNQEQRNRAFSKALERRRMNANLAHANLVRDIFGNPFRPVTIHPTWLTSTVTTLAEGIYQDRAFDRMSILADALQDTGCDNDDILTHCRGPGPHVRGCWVIDLLTGRQ